MDSGSCGDNTRNPREKKRHDERGDDTKIKASSPEGVDDQRAVSVPDRRQPLLDDLPIGPLASGAEGVHRAASPAADEAGVEVSVSGRTSCLVRS